MRLGVVILELLALGSIFGIRTFQNPQEVVVDDLHDEFIAFHNASDTCFISIPDLTCPQDLNLTCDEESIDTKIETWVESTGSSFNLGPGLTLFHTIGPWQEACSENTGSYDVTFTIFNPCGDSLICSSRIVIRDDVPPTFIQLDSIAYVNCAETDDFSDFVIRDDCDDHTFISYEQESFMSSNCGESYILRTWEAQDICGNTSFFAQKVVLIDTMPPIPLVAPRDLTVACKTEVVFDSLSFIDHCSGYDVHISDSYILDGCIEVFVRKWTAEDVCGNSANFFQSIYVVDTLGPEFINPPSTESFIDYRDVPDDYEMEVLDNCSGATVEFDETIIEGCDYIIVRNWTAKDSCGNTSTFDQHLIDTIRTFVYLDVQPQSCVGEGGSISVEIDGIRGPYQIEWSTGDTSSQLADLPLGIYSVSISDRFGCTITKETEMYRDPGNIEVASEITGTKCLVNNGVVELSVWGGVPPYSFIWQNGLHSTIPSLGGLGPGIHHVIVKDATQCETTHFFDVPYGESCVSSLAGTVWEDLNGNGFRDSDEALLPGIGLTLVGETGELLTTFSDEEGRYLFDSIENGDYQIQASHLEEFQMTETLSGFENLGSNFNPQTGLSPIYNLTGQIAIESIDLGLFRSVSVGDRIWLDIDGDCVQDANEVGVKDIAVQILNADLDPIRQTLSDEGGFYRFDGLSPGYYYITVRVPGDYSPCAVVANSYYDPEVSNEMQSVRLEVTSGQNFHFMDYGFQPLNVCQLSVIADAKDALCGLANGSISLSIIGCEPFTFQWSNGSSTRNLEGLSPGVYTCIITDVFGLQVIKDVFVQDKEGDLASEVIEYADPSCFDQDGFIHVEAFGGIAPYSYEWNTGQSNKFITELRDGKYEAIITDQAGCMDYLQFELQAPELCDTSGLLAIELGVFLEGPYDIESGIMTSQLMEYGYLPGQEPLTLFGQPTIAGQPYDTEPWNYFGVEGISAPEYPLGFIDWILVSLRTNTQANSTVCRKAAYLMSDGRIEFEQGFNSCNIDESLQYYVVIEHRNHLLVMSHIPVSVENGHIKYDFRAQQSHKTLFGNGQLEMENGRFSMYAGNVDQVNTFSSSRDINFYDILAIQEQSGQHSSYLKGDVDFNGDVNVKDEKLTMDNLGRFSDVPK